MSDPNTRLRDSRAEAKRLAGLLESAMAKRAGGYFSAKVTRNAKQDYQFEVEANGETWQGVLADVIEAANAMEQRFPASEPDDAAEAAKRLGNVARIQAARAKKAEAKNA